MTETIIHDLVYFDFEKASSIWSQFQWGQSQSITTTQDDGVDQKTKGSLGVLGYAGLSGEKGQSEKTSVIETKILHHDLLNRVEAFLLNARLVVDLDKAVSKDETSPEAIRLAIGEKPYIKAQGWSVIEDYKRILNIAEKFPEIVDVMFQMQLEGVKKNPEYSQVEKQIADTRKEIGWIKDRNAKAVAKSKLDYLQRQLDQMTHLNLSPVDASVFRLLDMLKLFVNTFMPDRINFRIFPFVECPSFQVLCNLKRECFVDQNLEHLLYGYGNRPNVRLSVFGLITSFPTKDNASFDPMAEFIGQPNLNEQVEMEQSLRNLVSVMDTFEGYLRFSRYPNITIHPIAVYRDFSEINQLETEKPIEDK